MKIICCIALLTAGAASGQMALRLDEKPGRMRDQRVELAMKIKWPFTFVGVGDMLQMVPISRHLDPDLQYLLDVMRQADMTVANAENTIMDMDNFSGQRNHTQAPREVADDWVNMGIRMVTKANNHTWDDAEPGLWANFQQIERVGIIHVGVGRSLLDARLARFAGTPKGTVGFVGMYADSSQLNSGPTGQIERVTPEQLAQVKAIRDSIVARRTEVENPIDPPVDEPGTVSAFGVLFVTGPESDYKVPPALKAYSGGPNSFSNKLHLTTFNGVTAEQIAQLRAIAKDTGTGDALSAFGIHFRVTPGPGEYTYDMDPQDERDILREVRTGKQFSDFEVATIHWHQNRFAFQHYSFDHYPADFEIRFAHDVIDQGADVFYAHGVHTIKGVEIYKGRPIFYGVSNFVVQEDIFPSWRDSFRPGGGTEPPTPLSGPIVGQGELNETQWEWMRQRANFEALLAYCHYEGGKLKEVRIYPVDVGGMLRPGSQQGIPRRPAPELAKKILGEVIEYSKPFGTKISIEDGVGVIRMAATAEAN